ncbi:MAG TPA: cytochrome C oxidase subunit II [Verrucomicrobiae bacterium]|jgi:cytochrome c oxidase subunit II|nr:cytochrome C oxidase subunit II [Verrucomicrobiae bacterium]
MRQKIVFALSIILVGCIILATRVYMIDIPIYRFFGGGRELNPATLHLAGEFVESNLGTTREPDGSYTVRVVATQYMFVPHCMEVPVGVPVRFRVTSADIVHGLTFTNLRRIIKVTPGTISEAVFEFPNLGEFDLPCSEFCGPGHFAMRSHIRVLPADQFANLRPDQRRSCDAPQ